MARPTRSDAKTILTMGAVATIVCSGLSIKSGFDAAKKAADQAGLEDVLSMSNAVLTTAGIALPVTAFAAWIAYSVYENGRLPLHPYAMLLVLSGVLYLVSQRMFLDQLANGDLSGPVPARSPGSLSENVAFFAAHYGAAATWLGCIAGVSLGWAGTAYLMASEPSHPG